MAKKTVAAKKRVVKVDGVGQLHVHSSFNNIIVTLTNGDGQVISWSSAGKMGFRGSKKNTPYAAQMAATDCAKSAYDLGMRKVKVFVKGPGSGRESAIRTLHTAGIEVMEIQDVTPLPHNGCRPPPVLHYHTTNFTALIDAPLSLGNFSKLDFTAFGIPHKMIFYNLSQLKT